VAIEHECGGANRSQIDDKGAAIRTRVQVPLDRTLCVRVEPSVDEIDEHIG
jgi:hypothetical protein